MPLTRPLAHRRPKTSGLLTYPEWAQLMAEESHALGVKMNPREIAEGLGVVEAESAGNASSQVPGNEHIGGLAESSAFGSEAERLNARTAVRAAIRQWAADGRSWWPAWGKWETGEAEGAGPTRYKKFLAIAEAALHGVGAAPAASSRPQGGRASSASSARPGESSAGGVAGDLMHAGLVGVLVLGGIGLIGFGGTRLLGASKAGKVASE